MIRSRSGLAMMSVAVLPMLVALWRRFRERPRSDQLWQLAVAGGSLLDALVPVPKPYPRERPPTDVRRARVLRALARSVDAANAWRELTRSRSEYERQLSEWRYGRQSAGSGGGAIALAIVLVHGLAMVISFQNMLRALEQATALGRRWGLFVAYSWPAIAVLSLRRSRPRLGPQRVLWLVSAVRSTVSAITNLLAGLESEQAYQRRRARRDEHHFFNALTGELIPLLSSSDLLNTRWAQAVRARFRRR